MFKLWIGYFFAGRLKYMAKEGFLLAGEKPLKIKNFVYRIMFGIFKGLIGIFKNYPVFKVIYKKINL